MKSSNTPMAAKKLRCAIYTRKSTDEGLDQEYNSLEANSIGIVRVDLPVPVGPPRSMPKGSVLDPFVPADCLSQ